MNIYEHLTSITISGGSTNTTTLRIRGGLMQQLLIRAATSGTTFRANLTDERGNIRFDYGFTQGELNDVGRFFPVVNGYTINITNASATDTFLVNMAVQE